MATAVRASQNCFGVVQNTSGAHTHGWRKKVVQNRQACPELNVSVPWLSSETLEIAGGRTFLRKVATSCVSACLSVG
jgi:hypothetical protein